MSAVIPNVGDVGMLQLVTHYTANADLKLHLFTNNQTPGTSDTLTSYTESTATGYGAITMTGSSWTIATTSGTSEASYPQQTFTYTASETVYGYFVTNGAGTVLLWAEKFSDGPYAIPSGGGTVKVTPNVIAQ